MYDRIFACCFAFCGVFFVGTAIAHFSTIVAEVTQVMAREVRHRALQRSKKLLKTAKEQSIKTVDKLKTKNRKLSRMKSISRMKSAVNEVRLRNAVRKLERVHEKELMLSKSESIYAKLKKLKKRNPAAVGFVAVWVQLIVVWTIGTVLLASFDNMTLMESFYW